MVVLAPTIRINILIYKHILHRLNKIIIIVTFIIMNVI